jgi:hypothetical protein
MAIVLSDISICHAGLAGIFIGTTTFTTFPSGGIRRIPEKRE